ncbi:hypothetical protein D9756_003416 [Leucocoprinus leucothites]|uniref:Uncharacterized protein n=1 Tax=Leucocoprinus leucothites TaxID=201217 RepID=A0A8H5G6H4_9AGAR|nr:hypothetical protein D9756_003416 [Leucoagaricus leucothites]
MKVTLLSLLLAAGALAQQMTINTPSAAPTLSLANLFYWAGMEELLLTSCVLPGSDPSGQALVNFPQQNGTSVTWLVNIQAGTSIGLTLRDNTGLTAQSAAFTVNPGSDTSCLSQTLSASGGTAAPPAQTGGGATTANSPTAGGNTTPAPTNTGANSASRTSTGTSAGSSASQTSGANANFASIGAAGAVGAAIAAFFA